MVCNVRSDMRETSRMRKQTFSEQKGARRRRLGRQGMTLIEIMIVVVIMALVATGVGLAVLPSLQKAKIQQTETAVQTVKSGVTMYIATNHSDCPTMDQLIETKTIDKSTATKDPWDHEFQIECEGSDISVRSAGPDGEFETADDIPKKK